MTAPFDWCAEAHAKLAAMDDLVAQGRGQALIEGGGCTEPGGGIVATQQTAYGMAALLRQQIAQSCGAAPTGGSVGGAYDQWWQTYGRRGGHPYAPPAPPPDTVSRNGRAVSGVGDVGGAVASVGYFAVGAAFLGLAAYGAWALWGRR